MGNENFLNLTNFHVHFSEILVKAKFTYENSSHSVRFQHQPDKTPIVSIPFHVGYHTPDMICFTRNSKGSINQVRLHDHLALRISILKNTLYRKTTMKFYVHHPGHLIRSLDNPSMSTSFSYYQLDTITEAKLSQGTTLRKRRDSKEKCTD